MSERSHRGLAQAGRFAIGPRPDGQANSVTGGTDFKSFRGMMG